MKLERASTCVAGATRAHRMRVGGFAAPVAVALLIAGFARVLTGRQAAASTGVIQGCAHVAAAHATPSGSESPAVYVGAALGSEGSLDSVLYAFSPADGALRWCDRFALTHAGNCPLGAHCPAPPLTLVGQPLAVADMVYVCTDPETQQGTLYALDARDGALRWSRQTDCAIVSMPYGDSAAPVYAAGVVYSGTYALRASDGRVPPVYAITVAARPRAR